MYAARACARAHAVLERSDVAVDVPDDADDADDAADAETRAETRFDASARRGALVHREGMFLVTFSERVVRVSAIGRSARVIGEFAPDGTDAGGRCASATWREASALGDRERGGGETTWDVRAGTGAEERLATSLATVSEGGEVFVTRCWRETASGAGGAEIERVIRLDDGERATCCASDDDDIVVGTDRGRVVFLTWAKGDEGISATIRRSERDGAATSVAWCPDTNTVVMRFDTGSVCAAQIDERGEVVARNWFDAFPDPSTCAAFHRGTRRLALGTADGDVRVYDDVMTSESSKPSRVFGLSAWGFSAEDTGAASYASWSHDGRALAVGWRRRGVSIWSESGCLLMCSLHHQGGDGGVRLPSPRTSSAQGEEETPEIGACLSDPAWGVGGYALYVVTRTVSGVQVMEYALARSVPRPRVSPRVSEHAVGDESSLLIGDDRVFIIASNAAGKFRIRQEICPHSYVQRQWPMRIAAMSPDGEYIAVAGSRGFVVYDTIREGWSESASFGRENSFEVVDFTWVRPSRDDSKRLSFLAAVSRMGSARVFTNSMKISYGVKFFSNCGSGSLVTTMPLPSEATHACSCGEFFAVAFANGEIALYEVRLPVNTTDDLMSVHPVRESDSRRRQIKLADGARVSGMCLVKQTGRPSDGLNGAPSECVVLTEDGEIFVVDLTGSHKQVQIFDEVAEFWVSDPSELDDQHVGSDDDSNVSNSDVLPTDRGCIFAYGLEGSRVFYFPEEGLRRVFADDVNLAVVDSAMKHSELEFDRELYPLAVSLKLNRMIGAKQKLSFTDSHESPYFMISPSVHTIVPYILRKLLSSGQFNTALRYARAARRQTPHFTHALEWLLFTALENSGVRDIASQDMLKQSIALLSELPNYLDIIVSVARKTDNTRWDSLFKYAGKPSDLCIKALETNQTQIAACYILVVDKLEGEDMGRKIAVRVMNRALDAREYRLVEDLIKFLLKPVDKSSLPNGDEKFESVFSRMLSVIAPRPKSVITLPQRGENAFALDDSEQELLKSHLDSLAQDKDIVSMGSFISNTSFDGVSYMKHETDHRGGAYIADFAEAVESAARCLRKKKLSRRAASTRSPRSESLALIDNTLEADSKSDATYVAELLDVAMEAECTDWSLLLATVLGRVDVLRDYFDKQPELRAPWLNISKQSVQKSNDPALVHHLSALVSEIERIFTAAA